MESEKALYITKSDFKDLVQKLKAKVEEQKASSSTGSSEVNISLEDLKYDKDTFWIATSVYIEAVSDDRNKDVYLYQECPVKFFNLAEDGGLKLSSPITKSTDWNHEFEDSVDGTVNIHDDVSNYTFEKNRDCDYILHHPKMWFESYSDHMKKTNNKGSYGYPSATSTVSTIAFGKPIINLADINTVQTDSVRTVSESDLRETFAKIKEKAVANSTGNKFEKVYLVSRGVTDIVRFRELNNWYDSSYIAYSGIYYSVFIKNITDDGVITLGMKQENCTYECKGSLHVLKKSVNNIIPEAYLADCTFTTSTLDELFALKSQVWQPKLYEHLGTDNFTSSYNEYEEEPPKE